jgi:hypothetical protein
VARPGKIFAVQTFGAWRGADQSCFLPGFNSSRMGAGLRTRGSIEGNSVAGLNRCAIAASTFEATSFLRGDN